MTLSYFHIDSFYPEEPHISPAPPPVFLLSSLIASVVIVVVPTVSVPLAEAGHIVAVVIVAGDPISISLAIAGHYSVAVVVPCNSICSTLAKSSAHISFLLVFEGLFGLLINPTSISSVAFQGVCFK